MRVKPKIWYIVVLANLLLFSCAQNKYAPIQVSSSLKLPKKVRFASDQNIMRFEQKLAKCGVKVITIGQNYMISIPANLLFPNLTPRLEWKGQVILTNVGDFLKQFRKVTLYIRGFTGKYFSTKRERALTLARARAVANNLWEQNIDSRFIFIEGIGADKPIKQTSQNGRNARIEIVFRDIVD